MAKNFILKCMLAFVLFPVADSFGKENTEMESFIQRVKETNTFVPVSNIWLPDNNFDKTNLLKSVERVQPLTIDYMNVATLMQQKTMGISLVVPGLDGGTYTIELARYDFFTNDFQVHERGENNSDRLFDYHPGLYYSGVVNGIPGSVAAFSFFKNEVYGVFSIPGKGNFAIVPNTQVGEYYNYNRHYILYNDNDLKIKDRAPSCAADQLPDLFSNKAAAKTTTTLNNNIYNNCTEVRCFETADNAMYIKKGSSTANATNYITAIFNNKATLYRNEGVPIVLKYVQINTAADQYGALPASSSRWLNKFGWVTQNVMNGCDIATLFTTKYGTMGGVAWLGLMCRNYVSSDSAGPYAFCNIDNSASLTLAAFPTFTWDVEVATHEMGHGLGSQHTHACAWGPTRTTAIDGCYTIEGSCPDPGDPSGAVGGTVMSYCHLVSTVGINFSNGFGQQPGDTVRYFLAHRFSSTCGVVYNPNVPDSKVNRTIAANRECTDATGTTYYWKDNNTADQTDDTLVLMIKKNGNTIGGLNTAGFAVSASTLASYGGGTGVNVVFPSGTAGIPTGSTHVSMRRYWKVTTASTPASAVEVIFPFLPTDTADINGTVPGATIAISSMKMYKVSSPIDPNPAANFPSATSSNFSIYSYNTSATTSNWSLTTSGTTQLGHMKMTSLAGGGGAFYSYATGTTDLDQLNNGGAIYIYPNPASEQWNVELPQSSENMFFNLYAADGRMVHTQALQSGTVNTVNALNIPAGLYFYRIIGGSNVYTGNLIRN